MTPEQQELLTNQQAGTSIPSSHMTNQSREYKLRAECQSDAELIRSHLAPWVERWQMNECHEPRGDGTTYWTPDVEVEFTISAAGPSKGELKWLINSITDCDIAAESLDGAAEYTGDRYPLDASDCIVRQPPVQTLQESRRTLRRYREYLEQQMDRASQALAFQDMTLILAGASPYARSTKRTARSPQRRPTKV